MTRIPKLIIQSAYLITPLRSCVTALDVLTATGLVNGKGPFYTV